MRALAAGAVAPDFALPDQRGRVVRMSDRLREGPVVLFFYPAALSPGCTRQACHFRDLGPEYDAAGAMRLGVSRDGVDRQREFADGHDLGYPLLADEAGEVATAYGVRRRLLTPVKRATFVVDRQQVVAEVITSELDMRVHADRALEAVRRLLGL
jgi:peroxiredoxin Q/BCP